MVTHDWIQVPLSDLVRLLFHKVSIFHISHHANQRKFPPSPEHTANQNTIQEDKFQSISFSANIKLTSLMSEDVIHKSKHIENYCS